MQAVKHPADEMTPWERKKAIDDGNADQLVAGFARAAQARRKLGQGDSLKTQVKKP